MIAEYWLFVRQDCLSIRALGNRQANVRQQICLVPSSVASGISSSTACPPKTYSTSNASIIPISTLASTLSVERADRFLGTYFVSPVSRMARVEVIRQIVRQRAKMGTQRRARKSKDAKRDPPRREPPREGERTRGKRTSFPRGDRHRCFARSPIINSSH
jgi:hypothetical protein